MPDTSHSPANDSIESANQRENAAAVLLKELDERQDSVLQELEQLNLDVEELIGQIAFILRCASFSFS